MTEVDQRWKDRMGRAKTLGFPPRSWTRGRQGKPSCEGRMGAEQRLPKREAASDKTTTKDGSVCSSL